MDEYKKEGVKGTNIKFTDNRPVIDMFLEVSSWNTSLLFADRDKNSLILKVLIRNWCRIEVNLFIFSVSDGSVFLAG